jgi:hypothetical protein
MTPLFTKKNIFAFFLFIKIAVFWSVDVSYVAQCIIETIQVTDGRTLVSPVLVHGPRTFSWQRAGLLPARGQTTVSGILNREILV